MGFSEDRTMEALSQVVSFDRVGMAVTGGWSSKNGLDNKQARPLGLGLSCGAGDENRTRALSLGITGALPTSVLVSVVCVPELPIETVSLVTLADRAVPLCVVRMWCGLRD
jgi:hypothetical protein